MNEQKIYITPKFDYWPAEELDKIEARMSGYSGGGGVPSPQPAITNMIIFKSIKTKKRDKYGKLAEDLGVNDYTEDKLLKLHPLFMDEVNPLENAESLFHYFRLMVTTFFTWSELDKVALEMIENFRDGSEDDYSSSILNQYVKNHKNTQVYVQEVKNKVIELLKINRGNLRALQFEYKKKEKSTLFNYIQDNLLYPKFNLFKDVIGGLTITIDDIWSTDIEVIDYIDLYGSFRGKLKFTLYDHFGLDSEDMKKWHYVTKTVALRGFRSWFALQHWDKFNGQFKPFVTVIKFEVPFEGRY